MTQVTSVDAERLVIAYLLTQNTVTALTGERIYSELPNGDPGNSVRVTLIDESQTTAANRLLYHTDSLLQIDCWGGPKVRARQIADTIRYLLDRHLFGVFVAGIVTGVKFGTYSYLPDETFNPARPRYVFQVHVFAHPDVPSGS